MGGFAQNFGSGKQDEGIPNIKGALNLGQTWSNGAAQAFTNTNVLSLAYNTNTSTQTQSNRLLNVNFLASDGETKLDNTIKNDVYGKSDHVTPTNYTIRVWLRTA